VIRIVGVQRHELPEKEFILLQNQGSLRINLKGHIVAGETAIATSDLSFAAHALADDALIPPGMYVLLSSGCGEPKWKTTKDGAMIYYTYMNRASSVWDRVFGNVHLLGLQHTYAERSQALLLR
jgi:hypothetical protein